MFICLKLNEGKIEVIHLWNGGMAILNIISATKITDVLKGALTAIINKREALLWVVKYLILFTVDLEVRNTERMGIKHSMFSSSKAH